MDLYYEVQICYIPQLLEEMIVLQTTKLLFVCWNRESSTVFQITHDDSLWQEILTHSIFIYAGENPRRQVKTDKDIYVLKEKLKDLVVQNTKLIAEIPSAKAILCQHDNVAKDSELMDFYHHNKPHIINTTTILELSNTLHQVSDGVKIRRACTCSD